MHLLLIAAVATATASIDLSPILAFLLQIAGLVLTGIVGWLGTRLALYFHVSTQSQLFANVLGAVDRGIAFAQQNLAARIANATGDKIALGSAVQAQAVNYVVSKLPDTLSKLGITPAHVADLVTAKLGSVPAAPPPSAPAG